MKDLIKKQEEELNDKFCVMLERAGIQYGESSEEWQEDLENFISKVRKETAKEVCDRMIRGVSDFRKIKSKSWGEERLDIGYDKRIEEEKEIKKEILINLNK